MIKVNLLRNQQKRGSATVEGDSFTQNTRFEGMDGGNSVVIKKVLHVLFPIIAVYAYSWYIEGDLNKKVVAAEQKVKTLETQSEGLKPQLAEIEKLNSEKNKINTQIGVIRDLSKGRYTFVKILDALQTLIPEKAWVIKFNIKDKTVNLEGRAIDDLVVSTFMQNLEESVFFSNVTWIDSKEVNEPQGLVKQFSIRFQLEKI